MVTEPKLTRVQQFNNSHSQKTHRKRKVERLKSPRCVGLKGIG